MYVKKKAIIKKELSKNNCLSRATLDSSNEVKEKNPIAKLQSDIIFRRRR